MRQTANTDDFHLLTIKETAERLRLSESCVYALVASGELPVVRVGLQKAYRVDVRDLNAFVSDRKFRYRPEAVRVPKAKFKHLRA